MEWLPITQEEAEQIAEWKYPPPYNFYDMTADIEDYEEFISPDKRSEHTYSVYNDDDLIGFFTIEPVQDQEVDIGLGMNPELTGKGGGEPFIKEGLAFARKKYGAVSFTLSVATFNKRAIKVYERLGFVKVKSFDQPTNGSVYPFIKMRKS